jgi:hypothetical protein
MREAKWWSFEDLNEEGNIARGYKFGFEWVEF